MELSLDTPPAFPSTIGLRPRFDLTYWPVLLTHVPPGCPISELGSYFDRWAAVARAWGRHAFLVDVQTFEAKIASTSYRNDTMRERQAHRDVLENTVVASARIAPHPMVRAVFKAYDWMLDPPYPTLNVPSASDAILWLYDRADEAELPLPSDPVTVLRALMRLRENDSSG